MVFPNIDIDVCLPNGRAKLWCQQPIRLRWANDRCGDCPTPCRLCKPPARLNCRISLCQKTPTLEQENVWKCMKMYENVWKCLLKHQETHISMSSSRTTLSIHPKVVLGRPRRSRVRCPACTRHRNTRGSQTSKLWKSGFNLFTRSEETSQNTQHFIQGTPSSQWHAGDEAHWPCRRPCDKFERCRLRKFDGHREAKSTCSLG